MKVWLGLTAVWPVLVSVRFGVPEAGSGLKMPSVPAPFTWSESPVELLAPAINEVVKLTQPSEGSPTGFTVNV